MDAVDEERTAPDEDGIAERFATLRRSVTELVGQTAERGEWFAMWLPVVGAVVKFGATVTRLLFRLRQIVSTDDEVEPIGETLRRDLVEDARAIRAEFPDVADAFFGMHHIDELLDAIRADRGARTAALRLLDAIGGTADRVVNTMIEVALGQAETSFGPERVMEMFERYERIAQRILDRWLLPNLKDEDAEQTHD